MTTADWESCFGSRFLITLTNEQRRYLGLSALSSDWDSMVFYRKSLPLCTRVTAFFDGSTIVKVISEIRRMPDDSAARYEHYTEYDTKLETRDRKQLLPLSARGKPKPLSAAGLSAVAPFGCSFFIAFESGKDTLVRLTNPRANKEFPIGEWEAAAAIGSEADFHEFMNTYIATCREDYFHKLRTFKDAKKVTVSYRPGDIFRMELDRTRYCYGIITGKVKQFCSMPELPETHSLRQLMLVPIMVRLYPLITDDPNLTADDLRHVPLGRMKIVGDNNIIWGTHTIVDHRPLAPDDLEFHFVCTKMLSPCHHGTVFTQDSLMHDGLIPPQEYTLRIEWGFAQTQLRFDQLSDKLKRFLADYQSPHGGVGMRIDPRSAVPDEKYRQHYDYRKNLLNPENRGILNEIFACLGLNADISFDRFAKAFGGLTRQEILRRMK